MCDKSSSSHKDSPPAKRRRLSSTTEYVKFDTQTTHERVVISVSSERLSILKHMLSDIREGEYRPKTSTSVKHTVTTREYAICVNLDGENDDYGNQWLSGYVSVDTKPGRTHGHGRPDHLPFFSFTATVPLIPRFSGVSPPREVDTSFFWGLQRMISLNELLKLDEREITVVFDIKISKPSQLHVPASHSTLENETQKSILSQMHASKIHPDFTITVEEGGDEIPCHKAVLCCVSPVFEAMFREGSEFHERKDNRVKISDFSKEVVRAFVDYVYLGPAGFHRIENEYFDWPKLFTMSEKYNYLRLCEDSIDQMLSIVKGSVQASTVTAGGIVGGSGSMTGVGGGPTEPGSDAESMKEYRENIMFSLLSFLGQFSHVDYLKLVEKEIFDVACVALKDLFGRDERFKFLGNDILVKWMQNVVT